MELQFFDDAAAFLAVAGDHLAADPVLGTVMANVAQRYADGSEPTRPGLPLWWLAVLEGDEVVGVAMRSAPFEPYPLYVLPMPDSAAVALARALHARGEHPGGVNGALPAARTIAEESARLFGGEAVVDQQTRLFECREVVSPPAVAGTLRPARHAEADLCLAWYRRFGAEADEQAGRTEPGVGHGEHVTMEDILQRLEVGAIWLLEDPAGEVVHLTARNAPAYGVSRIGPVYTPKEHRGRGYASYAVAELTRSALAEGIRVCLFTDQANPTSNKIYEAVGYRPLVDMANMLVR